MIQQIENATERIKKQRMSVEDYRKRVEGAKEAVKPLVDACIEFHNMHLPKIILHASGRLETCYSDEDEIIMAQYRQQIRETFQATIWDGIPEEIGGEMPGEGD